jgi:hypothetical protein
MAKRRPRLKSSDAVSTSDVAAAYEQHVLDESKALGAALRSNKLAKWLEFLPGRKAVRARAVAVARLFDADPKEIIRIIYSRGDLNSYLPTVLMSEQHRIQDVQRAKLIARLRKLLERANWPFDGEGCDVPEHPMSRAVVCEAIQQAKENVVRRANDTGTPGPVSIEADAEVQAAKAVGEILSQANWPFDRTPYRTKHLLSREFIEALSVEHDLQEANRRLREVQTERRDRGIIQGPESPSFQRAPVVRAIGRELWTYLARCRFTQETQNQKEWPAERIARLGFLDLHDALSRAEVAAVSRHTVDLVNLAFPNVARLTPGQLRGVSAAQRKAHRRRKARDDA